MLATRGQLHYVPVDVSRRILQKTADRLLRDFAGLRVTAIPGDYQAGIRFARANLDGPRCIVFLGSSIGNFDRSDAVAFLAAIAEGMGSADALLVGMDLRKDRRVLERAYDDAQGVTAAFNKNILARINRLFDGDFDLDRFAHRAWFDEDLGRVELHLVSRAEQHVRIEGLDLDVAFAAGESIHTENSYKYAEAEIDALAEEAGLSTRRRWFDGHKRFSLSLFGRSPRRAAVDPKPGGTPWTR
jgi:dimethylhistidine N-methyltransferase